MQLKEGLESVNGHWLLQFRWQFIPQYTTFILDRQLTKSIVFSENKWSPAFWMNRILVRLGYTLLDDQKNQNRCWIELVQPPAGSEYLYFEQSQNIARSRRGMDPRYSFPPLSSHPGKAHLRGKDRRTCDCELSVQCHRSWCSCSNVPTVPKYRRLQQQQVRCETASK